MTPERWREVRTILDAAMALEAEERAAYLDRVCRGDRSLRGEVESLLTANTAVSEHVLNPDWRGPDRSLALGSFVGPYEIVALLGVGGMGEVYRARDSRLHRDVAIKVLPERVAADPDALRRFHREARAVAAISHPNIVSVFDVGQQDSLAYVVLEYLEGDTLRARLERGRNWREGVEWLAVAAEAVAAVHTKGIVHRDLKPDNLFITTHGILKILDFGLASSVMATGSTQTDSALTEVGTVMGTIGYMSPEQVRGHAATAASDFFSLGCILYEVLTGVRAFQKASAADTLSAILNDQPAFTEGSPSWPAELIRIAQRCLAKNPDQRFQSGRDLAFALRSTLKTDTTEPAADSIAVLPFANAGGEDAEYLSDGIAESLINNLARIPRLHVVPRSTVFRYKRTDLDPHALGQQLQARLLLTGRVVQRGERLFVQADLVDAGDQKQLWGERFNGTSADIFEVEEEIARQISEKLRLKLPGEPRKQITDRDTEDHIAYDLYLKARYHWSKRTPESIRRAIDYLEAAIARDPNYARAWAGLSDTRILFGWYGAGVIAELFANAIAAARTAVRLNPDLAEAHAALGFGLCCAGEWEVGLQECERAMTLNPRYFLAYDWAAIPLAALGRFDEALANMEKAKALEPLSLVVHHHQAWVHVMARRFSEASRIARQALELDPDYSFAWWWLGIAQTEMGQIEDAVRSLERAAGIFADFTLGQSALGHAFGRAGRREDAMTCLRALERGDAQEVDSYHLALVHAGLGQVEEAIACVAKAAAADSVWLRIYGPHDPRLDRLRDDQRVRVLLKTSMKGHRLT
jgi:serine/threonine protein kinase/tetratricopeptide (TPR) repeat protein